VVDVVIVGVLKESGVSVVVAGEFSLVNLLWDVWEKL
jgi:hypothetical protein